MYHYKARIYSPSPGRFLQTDPIGYGGGMNIYAYVGGDPVNMANSEWVDAPSGDLHRHSPRVPSTSGQHRKPTKTRQQRH